MQERVEYQTSEIDWSKYVYLTDEQRQQLIHAKLERYRLQSEMNYNLVAHARDFEN